MEAEAQSEDSSSSPYYSLNNLITILRSASQNPLLLTSLIQTLSTQSPQLLASFDYQTLQNLSNPSNSSSQTQKPEVQPIVLLHPLIQNAKKVPQLEKTHSNDEETSTGSRCLETENILEDSKLETLKKNNKKLSKFEEVLDKIFSKLSLEHPDEIRMICIDVLKLIIPVISEHFKNKPFEAVAAAVMVFSCRNANYPITLKEIVSAASEQGKDITKMVNKCIFSLKSVLPEKEFAMKILNPEEMTKKIAQKLNFSQEKLSCALEVIRVIEAKSLIKGKHPNTVAACAIKISSILVNDGQFGCFGMNFEPLAEAANLNKITLKNSYRDLQLHSSEILFEMGKTLGITIKELPNL